MRRLTTLIACVFVAFGAAADELVLSGRPSSAGKSSSGSTTRTVVEGAESEKYSVVIVRSADRYFWASREDRELFHGTSGLYHYFIDPTGGGAVKVEPAADGTFNYYEQLSLGLATIVYWGSGSAFKP